MITLEDGIFMTPTLMKLSLLPTIKVIGTLSQASVMLRALGLEAMELQEASA
jgi:hypothetical protein